MSILSVQSHVAYGHVGNSAAVFPLQRVGVEVWPVHTVTFSNHTGYGAWRGPVLPADQVREVVQGIDDRGFLGQADALLTGYQGDARMGEVILDTLALLRRRNPRAIYCCDPVMGDTATGFYCLPGIPEFLRDQVVPQADVLTPNLFELDFLTGRSPASLAEVVEAAQQLRRRGPGTVMVTSVTTPDLPDDVLRMVVVDQAGAWQVETPLIEGYFTGTGDLTAAMFLAGLLRGESAAQAMAQTASVVYSVLRATADLGRSELALVEAQQELVTPSHRFSATQIG
ncbi:pyridoxal kinase [Luteococcus peritonei]